MNLLPFENIECTTAFSTTVVKEIIANNIAHISGLNKTSIYDYEGIVENNSFKIRRILKSGINSFIPTVRGVISKNGTGSLIELKLRLHKGIYIFTIIISVFALALFIMPYFSSSSYDPQLHDLLDNDLIEGSLKQDLAYINHSVQFDWMGLIFIFIPYLMATVGFNLEAERVKYKLKSILKIKNNK